MREPLEPFFVKFVKFVKILATGQQLVYNATNLVALRISVLLLVVSVIQAILLSKSTKRTQALHVYSGELAGTALPQVAECAGWMRLNPADRMPLRNEPKDAGAAPQSPHACNNGAACVAGGC